MFRMRLWMVAICAASTAVVLAPSAASAGKSGGTYPPARVLVADGCGTVSAPGRACAVLGDGQHVATLSSTVTTAATYKTAGISGWTENSSIMTAGMPGNYSFNFTPDASAGRSLVLRITSPQQVAFTCPPGTFYTASSSYLSCYTESKSAQQSGNQGYYVYFTQSNVNQYGMPTSCVTVTAQTLSGDPMFRTHWIVDGRNCTAYVYRHVGTKNVPITDASGSYVLFSVPVYMEVDTAT